MISAGEESGKLGEVLDEVSAYYGRQLKEVIKTVTSMLEPIMIVVMGSVVAFIAMAEQRLGRPEKARMALDRLRILMEKPANRMSEESHRFLREAEALIEERE